MGEYFYKVKEYKKCISDMNILIELMEIGNDQGLSYDKSLPYLYRALAKLKLGKTQVKFVQICIKPKKWVIREL